MVCYFGCTLWHVWACSLLYYCHYYTSTTITLQLLHYYYLVQVWYIRLDIPLFGTFRPHCCYCTHLRSTSGSSYPTWRIKQSPLGRSLRKSNQGDPNIDTGNQRDNSQHMVWEMENNRVYSSFFPSLKGKRAPAVSPPPFTCPLFFGYCSPKI